MTTTTAELLASAPGTGASDPDRVAACIEACFDCARACLLCADACLAEPAVADLMACVRLDASCADLCDATARVLTRHHALDPALAQSVLQTCVAVTRLCAEECESHADHHRHCQLCAEACRRCEAACKALLASIL